MCIRDSDGGDDGANVKRSLSGELADAFVEHSARLRSLKEAQDIFKDIGGTMGASLKDTVSRVMHMETKRIATRMRGDERVYQDLRTWLEAEEESFRRERLAFQEHMQRKREQARVEHELQEARAELQNARKHQRAAEVAVTAMEAMKAYSLEMLGKGRKHAGVQ